MSSFNISLPYNNRAISGNEINTKLTETTSISKPKPNKKKLNNKTSFGHFKKSEITCTISITKPKIWISRGYNEKK